MHQLNSKSNDPVLLFNGICFIFFSKLYRGILGVGEGTELWLQQRFDLKQQYPLDIIPLSKFFGPRSEPCHIMQPFFSTLHKVSRKKMNWNRWKLLIFISLLKVVSFNPWLYHFYQGLVIIIHKISWATSLSLLDYHSRMQYFRWLALICAV